jgi:hypothetical protein
LVATNTNPNPQTPLEATTIGSINRGEEEQERGGLKGC